jgi:predicted nucleic acid-binding protein
VTAARKQRAAARDELAELTDVLRGLPQVPHQPELFAAGALMVRRVKGSGLNVGAVDLLIAAQARLLRAAVMSGDAVFERLAGMGLIRTVPHR